MPDGGQELLAGDTSREPHTEDHGDYRRTCLENERLVHGPNLRCPTDTRCSLSRQDATCQTGTPTPTPLWAPSSITWRPRIVKALAYLPHRHAAQAQPCALGRARLPSSAVAAANGSGGCLSRRCYAPGHQCPPILAVLPPSVSVPVHDQARRLLLSNSHVEVPRDGHRAIAG